MAADDAENTAEKVRGVPFQPGHDPRRAPGRPKGARNALGEDFVKALQADFDVHGAAAIAEVREKRPQDYIKVIASVLPKQAEITVNEYEHLSDEQLRTALSSALRDLAAFGVDLGLDTGKDGGGAEAEQPTKPVSPLH